MSKRVNLAAGTTRGLLLDLIRAHGPVSRVALTERTGLTQPTVSAAVKTLLEDGLVLETGRGASTGGKPPVLLEISAASRYAVGVQLGSESTTMLAVDLAGGVIGRVKAPGVGEASPPSAAVALAEEIEHLLAALDVDRSRVIGVGVAAPGPLDVEAGRLLGAPQIASWVDVPIRSVLSSAVGMPVLLDNDATAAALGDFWGGYLDDSHAHATIYMGEGIGSGLLIDGIVVRGASSNIGELGQTLMTSDPDHPTTLQSLAAPRAVVERAMIGSSLAERYSLDLDDSFESFRRLAVGAAHGDADADAELRRSAALVAIAAVNLANIMDLDSILLAGPGFEVAGATYLRALDDAVTKHFFAGARHRVHLGISPQVSEAAAVGAAALVMQTFLAPRSMGITPVITGDGQRR